jgi:hypothetical protein
LSDPTDYLASHGYWPWEAPRLPDTSRQGPSVSFAPEPGTDLWFEWDSSRSPVGGPVRSPGSSPGGSQ